MAIYGIDLFLASLMLTVIIRYSATRDGLVAGEVADEELLANVRQRGFVLVVQAGAVMLALFAPEAAAVLYLLVALLFVITPLLSAGRQRSRPG